MKQLFKIKNHLASAELQIRIYSENRFTYVWFDEIARKTVYESEKIKTTSRVAVIFIGLIDFFAYFSDYPEPTSRIRCENQIIKDWFLAKYIPNIYSYEEKVTQKLLNCIDWLIENKERVDEINTPWKMIDNEYVPLPDTVKTISMTED